MSALVKNRSKSKAIFMKSDDIRTIFSIYQIWLAEEKERSAADLRECCESGQTKRQRIEKSRGGDALGRACKFERSLGRMGFVTSMLTGR
jgi:hypothetical protein